MSPQVARAVATVLCLTAFAYYADTIANRFGFFALPVGALAAVFAGMWLGQAISSKQVKT